MIPHFGKLGGQGVQRELDDGVVAVHFVSFVIVFTQPPEIVLLPESLVFSMSKKWRGVENAIDIEKQDMHRSLTFFFPIPPGLDGDNTILYLKEVIDHFRVKL